MDFDSAVLLIRNGKVPNLRDLDFNINNTETLEDGGIILKQYIEKRVGGKTEITRILLKGSILHVAIAAKNEDAIQAILKEDADTEAECDIRQTEKVLNKHGGTIDGRQHDTCTAEELAETMEVSLSKSQLVL